MSSSRSRIESRESCTWIPPKLGRVIPGTSVLRPTHGNAPADSRLLPCVEQSQGSESHKVRLGTKRFVGASVGERFSLGDGENFILTRKDFTADRGVPVTLPTSQLSPVHAATRPIRLRQSKNAKRGRSAGCRRIPGCGKAKLLAEK